MRAVDPSLPQPATIPSVPNRLWWRFGLSLLALTLLIGGIGVAAFRSLSADIRAETQRTLTVIAEQKRQAIEYWLKEAKRDAELYFSGTSQVKQLFGQWLDGGRQDQSLLERIRVRVADLGQARNWGGAAILDAAGQPVLVSGAASPEVHAAEVRELLRRPVTIVTELHRNRDGRIVYCVLVPIVAPDAPPLGVALVTWRADQTLYPLVASWPLPSHTAETYLVEGAGDQVRFLSPLRFVAEAALVETLPLSTPDLPAARAVQGQQGLIEGGRDYRGVPVLAYATPITETPWIMLAEIDRDDAYAGIHATVWEIGLYVGLALLVVYTISFLFWSRGRQRQALAALKAREAADARFRLLFEQHLAVMLQIDPANGRILDANQAAADFYGYSRDALRSMSIQQINCLPPEAIAAKWQQAAHRTKSDFIFPHRLADGSIRTVEVHTAPISIDDQLVLFSIVHDITQRREIEERLRLSEERHRLLADHSLDVIWTMDLTGRSTYHSPSVEKLLGYTPAEVLQLSLEEMICPESLPTILTVFEEAVANIEAGRPIQPFRGEIAERRKDGSTVWVETTATALYDQEGRFIEFFGVDRDITERKRYEQELHQARAAAEAANAAKSAFLAHVSHEIRTPLNAVLGLAQVLEKGRLAPDQRAMIAQIGTAGRSLLGILNDILDLSKIEAGQLQLEVRPCALALLLTQIEGLMEPLARGKGLELSIPAPPAAVGVLLADPLRLEQVLVNLIGNAIKFTDQGEIRVRIESLEDSAACIRLRFTVSDTGIGIAPEALSRLFTPFTQADGSITRRFGGTGLGLSICKRLVDLMDGEIGADSRPGVGSTFWFELCLPRAAAGDLPAPAPAVPSPAGPRLTGRHVLVVDDQALNREVVVRMLALEGAQATEAADGQQALELLRAQPRGFDAVLMDVQMPVMDGLSATRAIRGPLGLTGLPVIALTAGVLPEQQAAARAAGADAVLAKPLDLEQMVALLPSGLGPQPTTSVAAAVPLDQRPPATEPTAAFPEISGIDAQRAAQGLSHDRVFFLRLLQRFADECADVVTLARQDLDQGQRETAAQRLHRLRGMAGYLGALDLMRVAGDLEQAIAADETGLEGRLLALGDQVAALIAASAPWRIPADLAPDATAAAPLLDREQLSSLCAALRLNQAGARHLFKALEPALRGVLETAAMQRLGRAIRDLRFDAALAVLEQAALGGGDGGPASDGAAGPPSAHILLVDDDPTAILVLRNALTRWWETCSAHSGREALARLAESPVDLVLLDANMPDLDGFATCRALRLEHPDLPVMFVTAASDRDTEGRALEAGANDFVSKPINPPVVRARIGVHLKLKAQSDLLRDLANRDPLTGVANRRALDARLGQECQRSRRQQLPLGLLMVDIDHFKAYNDHYGHRQGDDCLHRVAQTLAATAARAGDLVARFGGEEFAVLLPGCSIEETTALAERIAAAVRALAIPHERSGTAPRVTVSIGAASLLPGLPPHRREATPAAPSTREDPCEELLDRADRALYAAKAGGRDRVSCDAQARPAIAA